MCKVTDDGDDDDNDDDDDFLTGWLRGGEDGDTLMCQMCLFFCKLII